MSEREWTEFDCRADNIMLAKFIHNIRGNFSLTNLIGLHTGILKNLNNEIREFDKVFRFQHDQKLLKRVENKVQKMGYTIRTITEKPVMPEGLNMRLGLPNVERFIPNAKDIPKTGHMIQPDASFRIPLYKYRVLVTFVRRYMDWPNEN